MEKKYEQKLAICKKCGQLIRYTSEETYWDNSGYGYSAKLVKCKECGTPHVLKYEEDSWLSKRIN